VNPEGEPSLAALPAGSPVPAFAAGPGYRPPPLLGNGHLQTLYPTLLRQVPALPCRRERIATIDGDFLDLDRVEAGNKRLLVICHGLESSSRAKYVRALALAGRAAGWDALAVNLRGCSGQPNRLVRSYHSGATEDLAAVLAHVAETADYREIALVGFSLGGNLVLKYAGERGTALPAAVRAVVGVSVPCDLESGAMRLDEPANRFYQWRFVRTLKSKLRAKCAAFPEHLDWRSFRRIRTVREFDDLYTAPVHGFADAGDYYRRCSCLPVLPRIAVPALVVNAADDPFLGPSCFPFAAAAANPRLQLLVPDCGGHVGFVTFGSGGRYWHENRILNFLNDLETA